MITVKFCKKNEKKTLVSFLKKNWPRRSIVFIKNNLFNWLYFDKKKNRYNFLITTKNKKIQSCLGITKYNLKEKDFKGSIWLTFLLSNSKIPISSLNLISYVLKKYKKFVVGTVGLNKEVFFLYKYLGFKTGYLSHFFFPNPNIKNYGILRYKRRKKYIPTKKNKYLIFKSNQYNFFSHISRFSNFKKKYLKDFNYYKNKYSLNPFYQYHYLLIKNKSKIYGFFVARETYYLNKKALRLVEFFGDINKIKFLKNQFKDLILRSNYEYLDFYCHGVNERIIQLAGFEKNNFNKKIIVPNYFEPFEKRNVKLPFALFPKNVSVPIFKGDADQDRPNMI